MSLFKFIPLLIFYIKIITSEKTAYVAFNNDEYVENGSLNQPFKTLSNTFNNIVDNSKNIIIFKENVQSSKEYLDINLINTSINIYSDKIMHLININERFSINLKDNSILNITNIKFTSKNIKINDFIFKVTNNSFLYINNCKFIDIIFEQPQNIIEILLNSYMKINFLSIGNVIVKENYFLLIEETDKECEIKDLVIINSRFYDNSFLKIFSSLIITNLSFEENFLISSVFLEIYNSFTIINSNFISNSMNKSNLMQFKSKNINSIIKLNNLNITLNFYETQDFYNLISITMTYKTIEINKIIFKENICFNSLLSFENDLGLIMIIDSTFQENLYQKAIFLSIISSISMNNMSFISNNRKAIKNSSLFLSDFQLNFAGSCLFFQEFQSISIENSTFLDNYASILPSVLFFNENEQSSQNFIEPKINIKFSNFQKNLYEYSESSKYQGCAITSISIAYIFVKSCIFDENIMFIPSSPLKGGPCLNINRLESELSIESSKFLNNKASFQSNAIFFQGKTFFSDSNLFSNNTEFLIINVKQAGALYLIFELATILNNKFLQNKGYNGGLSISQSVFSFQILIVKHSIFSQNWASYSGSGINIDETGLNRTCLVENSSFILNYADNYAAAVFIYGAGATLYSKISFVQCLFERNIAVWEGGAFSIWLYYPLYEIYFNESIFNGSQLIGTGNSIMGACLDFWGDSSWIKSDQISFLKTYNCYFNNSFSYTGSGLYMVMSFFHDFNSTFNHNYAAREGGTIQISDNSQLFLNFTKIYNSNAEFSAGCIGGKEEVRIFINNAVFSTSKGKSGVGLYLDSNSLLFGNNVSFIANDGEVGSGILIRNSLSISFLNNSVFLNNIGSYSVVQIEYSTLFMENSSFSGSNVASFSLYSCSIQLINVKFFNNSCSDEINGCLMFVRESSSVFIRNLLVANISGKKTGGIYIEYSNLDISKSDIKNCISKENADFLYATQASITLKSFVLEKYKTTGLNIIGSKVIINEFNASCFGNIITGSTIHCFNCLEFLVENSNFHQINSNSNGAGILLNNNLEILDQNLIIKNTKFSSNKAKINGGALFIENIILLLTNCNFNNNNAQNGGAIFSQISDKFLISSSLNIFNNSFVNNSAEKDGGAIKWSNKKPLNLDENIFYNNNALYGINIASFPVCLGLTIIKQNETSNFIIYDTLLNNSDFIYFDQIQSGVSILEDLEFYYLDEKNERISTISDDYLKIEILIDEIPESISNKFKNYMKADFYKGNFTNLYGETFQALNPNSSKFLISDLTVVGTPTTIIYLKISVLNTRIFPKFIAPKLNNYIDSSNNYYFILPILLRECNPGEIYSDSDNQCNTCTIGKYSFNPRNLDSNKTNECLNCIENAICPGGYVIELNENYWRSNIFSTDIYLCNLNAMSCLGGLNSDCLEGYEGALCDVCKSDNTIKRSKNYLDLCSECRHPALIVFIELILLFAMLFGSYVIVFEFMKEKNERKAKNKQQLFIFKLLICYFQFIFVSKCYNISIPVWYRISASIFEVFSLVLRNLIDSSCLFLTLNLTKNHQFANLMLGSFFLLIIFTFIFIIIRFKFKKISTADTYLRYKVEAFLTICYCFKGTMIFLSLNNTKCILIENKLYLQESPDYECFSESHILIIFFFSIPNLILFCIFYPLVYFNFYIRTDRFEYKIGRRQLWNIGYVKSKRRVFELFIFLMQIILICSIVYWDQSDIKKAISSFLIVLSLAQGILIIKPFKYKFITKMNIFCFVAISLIYLSFILYFNTKTTEGTRTLISVIAILFNISFIFTCLFFIFFSKNFFSKNKKIGKMKIGLLIKKLFLFFLESFLKPDYDKRFKAFKTFGSSFDKKDRNTARSELGGRTNNFIEENKNNVETV